MDNILIVLEAIFRVFIFFGVGVLVLFIGFMLIQLISYRIFNFNIYKRLMKELFD